MRKYIITKLSKRDSKRLHSSAEPKTLNDIHHRLSRQRRSTTAAQNRDPRMIGNRRISDMSSTIDHKRCHQQWFAGWQPQEALRHRYNELLVVRPVSNHFRDALDYRLNHLADKRSNFDQEVVWIFAQWVKCPRVQMSSHLFDSFYPISISSFQPAFELECDINGVRGCAAFCLLHFFINRLATTMPNARITLRSKSHKRQKGVHMNDVLWSCQSLAREVCNGWYICRNRDGYDSIYSAIE